MGFEVLGLGFEVLGPGFNASGIRSGLRRSRHQVWASTFLMRSSAFKQKYFFRFFNVDLKALIPFTKKHFCYWQMPKSESGLFEKRFKSRLRHFGHSAWSKR